MSRRKVNMKSAPWIVLTVAGAFVSFHASGGFAADGKAAPAEKPSGITAVEQPDGRTRLTIKASDKPKFTTWKMERPARVVVDITGVTVAGVDAPFDAGTYAVGNVGASAEGGKTRVTMTLRRGADYQVQAQGNNIVIDVTPWEAPPLQVAADPALLEAARKDAANSDRARLDAEARATKAEQAARSLVQESRQKDLAREQTLQQAARTVAEERKLAEQERRAAAEQTRSVAEERKAAAQERRAAAEQVRTLAEERKLAEQERRAAAEQAARTVAEERKLVEQERRAAAEQVARNMAEERQRVEQARREAAEQVRTTAALAVMKLDAEKVALEASRAKAEAAQVEAQRMASALSAERAAIERARKGVQEAQAAANTARLAAAEGDKRSELLAAERATKHLAKEQLALLQRRAQAEASQKAAELAMERLALQKQDVQNRQQQAEQARASALAAAKMLETDRQKAVQTRLDAERLRAAAQDAERKARSLLAQAEVEQKRAEARQKQGSKDDAQAARVVSQARQQTVQARAAAESARVDVARMESERKQLASEREALSRQQAALAQSERQARVAALRASEVTAKAVQVQAAMARLEQEKETLTVQKKALQEQQESLAAKAKATAAAQAELDSKSSSFAQAMKAQQLALAKSATEHQREQARLQQAEEQLQATKTELSKREQALAEITVTKANQGKQAADEQAKLAAAKAALQTALTAHADAEHHRKMQEEKLQALTVERAALESSRSSMEQQMNGLKSELASAKAEVARLKLAPKAPPAALVAAAVVAQAAPAKIGLVPSVPKAPIAPVRQAATAPRDEGRVVNAAEARPRSVTLRVPSRVSRIDFVDEPSRSSVIIDLEEPTDFSIERSTGRRVTLRLHHADLPKVLERSMDATQFFGPVRLINSYRDPSEHGAVRVEVELAEMVPNRVRTDGTRLYWDFDKLRPGSAATVTPGATVATVFRAIAVAGFTTMSFPVVVAQEAASSRRPPTSKRRFNGRRIDLDFKGADIHNILRLLAEVGGVNIVTSDDVKGEVTIKMRDVPWDQALDVVLRAKVLGQVREGNLIRVAPIQVLEKELEQEISKQKQLTEVMPTETRLIGVSYAEAKELEQRAKDLLSGRGKVSVDERTNNLIVSDVAKNLALVEELVRNLDTQTSQVVIEARIIEARSTFVRALGVQWGGTSFLDAEHGNPTGLVFPNSVGVGGGATDANGSTQGLVPRPLNGLPGAASQSPNYAVNLPAAVGAGSGGALGLTLGSVAGALNLNLRLSALEQSGQVRILSSPRISTMDNVQASIEQGVAIPISVISAQGVQTVFVDAKLNLTVKPHVTNEGTVIMNVHVTRNEPDFVNTGARGDPTILKKEAKTVMLVRDGDTAVIGGIYQRNSGLNYSKVPFFADIPILGFFFRARRENDDRTEFLVFITPRIANRSRSLSQ